VHSRIGSKIGFGMRPRTTASKAHAGRRGTTRHVELGSQALPTTTVVPAGCATRVLFHVDPGSPDGDIVVFPALGRALTLPLGVDAMVRMPSLAPGEYVFTCSRGIVRGTIVAVASPVSRVRALGQRVRSRRARARDRRRQGLGVRARLATLNGVVVAVIAGDTVAAGLLVAPVC
jgi:hypothetical protein